LTTTKEGVKNISKPTKAGAAEWILATHVILAARIGITQHLVCMSYRFEFFLRLCRGINVRVQLASELAVSLFNLFFGCVSRDA
jgi:hypothetical protein